MMPRWMLLLCAYLMVWIPFNFSALANRTLPSIDSRGLAAGFELAANAIVAIVCATAGFMLWVRNPAGAWLGRAALVLVAAITIQAVTVSTLPRDLAPGLAVPIVVVTLAHAIAWTAYINRSKRLRAWLGEDPRLL